MYTNNPITSFNTRLQEPAAFNTEHYGCNGLNGAFELDGAIYNFAGGQRGGVSHNTLPCMLNDLSVS